MTEDIERKREIQRDYNGRVIGWTPIRKKPLMYSVGIGPKICSHCGKLYIDSWSMFCSLDGKWLVNTEFLDLEHRKMLGFDEPSHMPKHLLTLQKESN
jgi:hypothetical protein